MLTAGKVLKTHGIRGEVKVQSYMDSLASFKDISVVFIKSKEYEVTSVKYIGDFCILKLKGIDTVEEAELFRNCEIGIDREELPLPDGRYYIVDLIGCEVFAGEKSIGKLSDVLQYSSTDVYSVTGEKNVMFPLADGVFIDADIKNKKIFIDERRFDEVAVYED